MITLNVRVGSNPTLKSKFAPMAKLVKALRLERRYSVGSTPTRGTKIKIVYHVLKTLVLDIKPIEGQKGTDLQVKISTKPSPLQRKSVLRFMRD